MREISLQCFKSCALIQVLSRQVSYLKKIANSWVENWTEETWIEMDEKKLYWTKIELKGTNFDQFFLLRLTKMKLWNITKAHKSFVWKALELR